MSVQTELIYDAFDVFFRAATAPASFFVALVAQKNADTLDAAAATDEGGGLVGISVTAQPYSPGDLIRIDGTTNYDGEHEVHSSSTTNKVVIATTFTAETFGGTETIYQAPGPDDITMADLVEIATGNGYTSGGISISRNTTDFDSLATDTANNQVNLQLKDVVFTASGGSLPSSGKAYYAVLTGPNATVSARKIYASGWLNSANGVNVADAQSLTITDMTVRGSVSI